MMRKGKWFRGNVFVMSSKQLETTKKYEIGVMKPTALEVVTKKGKKYSRYYHKPVQPGEFWD